MTPAQEPGRGYRVPGDALPTGDALARAWTRRLWAARLAAHLADTDGGDRRGRNVRTWQNSTELAFLVTSDAAGSTARTAEWESVGRELGFAPDTAQVGLLLPQPGDPRGLSQFGAGAVDSTINATAGVVLCWSEQHLLLIPRDEHEGLVSWESHILDQAPAGTGAFDIDGECPLRDVSAISEADRLVRAQILEAEVQVSEMGLRSLGAAAGRLLQTHLDQWSAEDWPASVGADRRRVLTRVVSLGLMCDIALIDESPAVTATDALERARILRDLDRTVRRAFESAFTWRPGREH